MFESEDYRRRLGEINDKFGELQTKAFDEEAAKHHIALLRMPNGFSFAPAKEGEVISPEEYDKLPAESKKQIERATVMLQEILEKVIHQVPRWRRERHERSWRCNCSSPPGPAASTQSGVYQRCFEVAEATVLQIGLPPLLLQQG